MADDDCRSRESRMATGGLSHLIGAYYLLAALACDCNPQDSKEMRAILLHLKGLYWGMMSLKFGIENPKKGNNGYKTRDLGHIATVDPSLPDDDRGEQSNG